MKLRTIASLGDLAGRRVLLRADLNVPLRHGEVADDFRIRASLPTIQLLREAGAVVVLASHLGRPTPPGDASLSLGAVAVRTQELLGSPVRFAGDAVGDGARAAVGASVPGDVVMLENLRFDAGETADDPAYASALAAWADVYVDDAFGAAHRAHASVHAVAERLPSAAGLLLLREVEVLSRIRDSAERPFVAVLGGAKVSDKLDTIRALAERVDALLIGGAMVFTPIAAGGGRVGKSLCEPALGTESIAAIEQARSRGVEVVLAPDAVAAPAADASAAGAASVFPSDAIPDDLMGLDIGPASREAFASSIRRARTVFWNGPLGVSEVPAFARGTEAVAKAIASSEAFSVVGGGDSLSAVRRLGLEAGFDHLSTGGGASLEFIEGRALPGIEVLREDV